MTKNTLVICKAVVSAASSPEKAAEGLKTLASVANTEEKVFIGLVSNLVLKSGPDFGRAFDEALSLYDKEEATGVADDWYKISRHWLAPHA